MLPAAGAFVVLPAAGAFVVLPAAGAFVVPPVAGALVVLPAAAGADGFAVVAPAEPAAGILRQSHCMVSFVALAFGSKAFWVKQGELQLCLGFLGYLGRQAGNLCASGVWFGKRVSRQSWGIRGQERSNLGRKNWAKASTSEMIKRKSCLYISISFLSLSPFLSILLTAA